MEANKMSEKKIMSAEEYIHQLKMMYRSQFDLKADKEICGRSFDLYGFSHIKNKKYFASKEIKIWEYAQFEHCLVQKETSVSNNPSTERKISSADKGKIPSSTEREISSTNENKIFSPDDLLPDDNFLENTIDQLVEPNMNHKQSYITYIKVVENGIPDNLIKNIKRFSYSKSFALGFMGWCDIRLIIVDLANNQVFANKKGEKVKHNYLPERFIKARTS